MKFVKTFLTALLFFHTPVLFAQDLSGIWQGYFITDNDDKYKYEVQLYQSKKNVISGVTYSYLDTRFYGKATFAGSYTKEKKSAILDETKTVEVKMAGGSVTCIMKCRLVYSRSGNEETLEGVYVSKYEKSNAFYGVSKNAGCGGGTVFLHRATKSDFYEEPFLRNKKTRPRAPKADTARTSIARRPASKTPTKNQTTAKKSTPKNNTTAQRPVQKPVVIQPDTKTPDVAIAKPVVPKAPPTPINIRERTNELAKVITVGNKEVQISLYDNGEVDDDTVSIYLDGALLLANKRLSTKPITYTLHLDETTPEHTLVMVAENLGRIPPNTSLMIIQDGDKRYQVGITSTTQKNAMVRFRYGANNE